MGVYDVVACCSRKSFERSLPVFSASADFRLQACASQGLASALHLASKCSGITASQLEKLYRMECQCNFFDAEEENVEDDVEACELGQEEEAGHKVSGNEVASVLGHIKEVAVKEFAEEPAEEELIVGDDPDAKMPDGLQVIGLTEAKPSVEGTSGVKVHTLREALIAASEDVFPSLWRLAVCLRCGEHGMDSSFLKAAEIVRKRSRKLTWLQWLGLPSEFNGALTGIVCFHVFVE